MSHILIIDDSIFICKMIENILFNPHTQVTSFHSARDSFSYLENEAPDLILLAFVLPDMDGHIMCKKIKQMEHLKKVPVLFLTSTTDEKSIVQGFEAGATDYIGKPFSAAELKARVLCHLQNKAMADRLRVTNQRLLQMMDELKKQSNQDALTMIYNRKFFLEHLEIWRKELKKSQETAYFLLIDVDTFKQINDTYGHINGDYVLYTVADYLKNAFDHSYPIRWGGDEFLLVLYPCTEAQAIEIGEKIRRQIAAHVFTYDCDGSSFHCSLTIGMSEFLPNRTLEEILELADKALYLGKKRGRNCCISNQDPEILSCQIETCME